MVKPLSAITLSLSINKSIYTDDISSLTEDFQGQPSDTNDITSVGVILTKSCIVHVIWKKINSGLQDYMVSEYLYSVQSIA